MFSLIIDDNVICNWESAYDTRLCINHHFLLNLKFVVCYVTRKH